MSSPTFFSDGNMPNATDTKWKILQKILGATVDGGGTGGGSGAVLVGHGNPAVFPTGQAVYTNLDTGAFYYWDAANNVWQQLIGP